MSVSLSGVYSLPGNSSKEILERDTKDSTRSDSPLVADDEAVVIDTTGKTIEETADYIQRLFL